MSSWIDRVKAAMTAVLHQSLAGRGKRRRGLSGYFLRRYLTQPIQLQARNVNLPASSAEAGDTGHRCVSILDWQFGQLFLHRPVGDFNVGIGRYIQLMNCCKIGRQMT